MGKLDDWANDTKWYDVIKGSVWDTITLKPGQTFRNGRRMFTNPIGDLDPDTQLHKTSVDTSMSQCQMLPIPTQMMVRRIVFSFSTSVLVEDMFNIAEEMLYQFWMGQKWYSQGQMISLQQMKNSAAPIKICNYCKSVWVMDSKCPNCGASDIEFIGTEGTGEEIGNGFVLDLGEGGELHILQGMRFYMDFDGEDLVMKGRMKMWCHLEGRIARGVQ